MNDQVALVQSSQCQVSFGQAMVVTVLCLSERSEMRSSELSYQPCKAHSFLSGVRDGQRIDRQFIHPCAEQFEQSVLDLVFIPKD